MFVYLVLSRFFSIFLSCPAAMAVLLLISFEHFPFPSILEQTALIKVAMFTLNLKEGAEICCLKYLTKLRSDKIHVFQETLGSHLAQAKIKAQRCDKKQESKTSGECSITDVPVGRNHQNQIRAWISTHSKTDCNLSYLKKPH